MKRNLKILLLEDNDENTIQINEELSRMRMRYSLNVLNSKINFKKELENFKPDLVISDFSSSDSMALLNSINPFYIMKEHCVEVPLIFLTNEMSEEIEIGCSKAGADEYILNDKLVQLPSAIKSAFSRKSTDNGWIADGRHKKLLDAYLEMEERNRHIIDSITCAKRIQEAILPKTEILAKQFPKSFIFYRPKDIVSGDFYWFEEYQTSLIVVVADCTGHGVSGALISMIGHCLLNTIVVVNGITDPGEIIKKLNQGIRHFLKQDHGENLNGDGMDLAVCTINKQNNVLKFAGANRSLYYLIDKKIELIKGNKYGVGGWPGEVLSNFETHSRSFDPNGIIYLTTDGFCDQLGGIFSRRISTKRMLNWLQAINTLETSQQERIINQLFEEWRGENEQTDDVLMIGIRLNAITGNKK